MDDARLAQIKAAITARGWNWHPGKTIPYGAQIVVTDGVGEATLDFYPKRGRCVIGGTSVSLRAALGELVSAFETPTATTTSTTKAAPATAAEIGMDESGKGDWFGPLVVAAVYVEPSVAMALRKAGVKDSKLLEAGELERAAAAIERIVPAAAREVCALEPAAYNRRYAALGNINLLLAELYAETAAPVIARTGAQAIICDQFAQRAERLDSAFARAGLPRPRQMHHAEAVSVAVAAASVLATTRFQAELARLGAAAGLGAPLPRGASAITLLRRAARAIIAREGRDGLGRYAKLNFKPVQEILGGA
jgi:ribonuclease HIII